LLSFLDDGVVAEVVRKGVHAYAYKLVDALRDRFSVEVCSALAGSNLYQRSFARLFRRTPSVDELMKEINRGRFNGIAQSEGFINRIRNIKELIDRVLLAAESKNVYLPTYITSAQRGLAIRGNVPLGVAGEGMVPMPRSVGSYLTSSSSGELTNRYDPRHKRGGSRDAGSKW